MERDSERIAHSEAYLRSVVDTSGLLLLSMQVPGHYTELNGADP